METYHVKTAPITTNIMLFIFTFSAIISGSFIHYFVASLSLVATGVLTVTIAALSVILIRFLFNRTYLFTLTFMHCQFHSRYGGWVTPWQNIVYIGHAELSIQGWQKPLPWIGIQIKDYDEFVASISLRLASRIMLEQRILLILAMKNSEENDIHIEDIMFDDEPYTTKEGRVFKGLRAMLANRMRYNRHFLGFDFFIAEELLDRPIDDFIGLLRRYKAAAVS